MIERQGPIPQAIPPHPVPGYRDEGVMSHVRSRLDDNLEWSWSVVLIDGSEIPLREWTGHEAMAARFRKSAR